MIGFKTGNIEIYDDVVISNVTSAKERIARRFGFRTMRAAQASIVDGKNTSRPGKPPRGHTKTLKNNIKYAYEPSSSTVIVGATLLSKRSTGAVAALEHGGMATNARGRVIYVEARPFMSPALQQVSNQKMPEIFQNTFRN